MIRGKLYFSDNDPEVLSAARSQVIRELRLANIPGATLYPIDGVWNGELERGFVLEVLRDSGAIGLEVQLESIALGLVVSYSQDTVLVTVETVDGWLAFVRGDK